MEDKVGIAKGPGSGANASSVCKVHVFTVTLAAPCLMAGYGVFVLLVLLLKADRSVWTRQRTLLKRGTRIQRITNSDCEQRMGVQAYQEECASSLI